MAHTDLTYDAQAFEPPEAHRLIVSHKREISEMVERVGGTVQFRYGSIANPAFMTGVWPLRSDPCGRQKL